MAKTKVKTKFAIIKYLDEIINDRSAKNIGDHIVNKSKSFISKGISPVRKERKFKQYASVRSISTHKKVQKNLTGERKKALSERIKKIESEKYPMDKQTQKKYPGKKKQPVNLTLSGNLLSYFKSWIEKVKGRKVIKVGIDSDAPEKIKKIAEAHNDGTLVEKNVPKRSFVPNKKGEKYIKSIQTDINDMIAARVNEIIKKSNK